MYDTLDSRALRIYASMSVVNIEAMICSILSLRNSRALDSQPRLPQTSLSAIFFLYIIAYIALSCNRI